MLEDRFILCRLPPAPPLDFIFYIEIVVSRFSYLGNASRDPIDNQEWRYGKPARLLGRGRDSALLDEREGVSQSLICRACLMER